MRNVCVRWAGVLAIAAAGAVSAAAGERESNCLQVLTRAFADQGRENQRALLQALGAQLRMSPSRLEETLKATRGGVSGCFERLTALAR